MPYQRHNDQGGSRRAGNRHGFSARGSSGGQGGNGQRRSWREREGYQGGQDRPRREGGYQPRSQRDGGDRDDRRERPARGGRPTDRQRSGGRGGRFDRDGKRPSRAPQHARIPEPRVPQDVEPSMLEASARRELRALGRANAENVARHLVMLQRLLESDPEQAYQHARYASSHAGRVAVVRESAGIAAYLAGHYQEALSHIRAARRLSGLDLHHAIEADCERALGRLDQALKVAAAASAKQLDDLEEAEIAMVVSGVRAEKGQPELGLVVIEDAIRLFRGDRETLRRMHSVRADRLTELGREQEADRIRARIGITPEGEDEEAPEPEEEIVAYDLEEDYEPEQEQQPDQAQSDAAASAAASSQTEGQEAGVEPAAETPAPTPEHPEPEEDTDASWKPSFAQRVEDELNEILAEAGIDPRSGTADAPAPESGPEQDQ